MLDDYKIAGPRADLRTQVEQDVVSQLQAMAQHMRLGVDEIVNTALKFFISRHKDFLPPDATKTPRD